MTVATGVLAGTYIPTAYTVFAETEQKEDFKENHTKIVIKIIFYLIHVVCLKTLTKG